MSNNDQPANQQQADLSEDNELIDGCRRTLDTLAQHQGPHGEIPNARQSTTTSSSGSFMTM
ncbi:MAG: hypothetical protein EA424_02835 [Planctomycetaceae bacterium]|nr:MAG: hypothetical protein EA424_02835 [Planctomycetaceae bacterium]